MRVRNASVVAAAVASHARGLHLYLRRIEQLHSSRHLRRVDVERSYAGGFLEFYTVAERALERLFVGLIRGELATTHRGVKPVAIGPAKSALAVVCGERKFVDWLPYDRHTRKRARAYFAKGRPFYDLAKSHRDALEDAGALRNALAHRSEAAMREFRKRFVAGKALPRLQRLPAGYLRGQHTIGQTRMNVMLGRIVAVFNDLAR